MHIQDGGGIFERCDWLLGNDAMQDDGNATQESHTKIKNEINIYSAVKTIYTAD